MSDDTTEPDDVVTEGDEPLAVSADGQETAELEFDDEGSFVDEENVRDVEPDTDEGTREYAEPLLGDDANSSERDEAIDQDETVLTRAAERAERTAERVRTMRGLRSGTVVVALVLALLAASIALFADSPTLNPIDLALGRYRNVEVPDLSGLTQPKALQLLNRSDLDADISFAYSSYFRGFVTTQDPPPGKSVARGSEIKIVVSQGQTEFVMPGVVGADADSATGVLERVGATVEVTKAFDEVAPDGQVMKQEPTPGELVSAGRPVKLLVSQGAIRRRVPDIRQLPLEGGTFVLGRAGFVVGSVEPRQDQYMPAGAIIATEPPVDAIHAKGTKVKVIVSSGPPPVKVPNVVGLTEQQAIEQIKASGLLPSSYSSIIAANSPDVGKVSNQAPPANDEAIPLSVVNFEVKRGEVVLGEGPG